MKINAEQMKSSAVEAERLLKALANRHRLMILCQLIGAEHSVGELAGFLRLRDSTVSQHLALLRKDGLVDTRRDGQTIWYAIASDAARQIMEILYKTYCSPDLLCAPRRTGRASKPDAGRIKK